MPSLREHLKLCLVIGPQNCGQNAIFTTIKQAVVGGVTSVQLRVKTLSENQVVSLASEVLKILPSHVPLIINDYVEVAKFLNLGVHLGQQDMPLQAARRRLGQSHVIGLSIENIEQAKQYAASDADYFGIGPIFATDSKADATPAIGVKSLQIACQFLRAKPKVAIGGIHAENINYLWQTGIDGVAVISAIAKASDPMLSAQQLISRRETYEEKHS